MSFTLEKPNASSSQAHAIVAEPAIVPKVGRVHHAVPDQESTALDLDDSAREYGDFDAGDHVGRHSDIDAGAIHSDSDRDASVGEDNIEEKNFGSEMAEYDDERFEEALQDELGGTGEGAGAEAEYEIADEKGGAVDVSRTQKIFPGSDKW